MASVLDWRLKILILVIALALVVWWLPAARRWFAIDRCLDRGGRWDYTGERCEQ